MLLNFAEDLSLDASADDVWRLLRDTPRLAGLLPGVQSVTRLDEQGGEAYSAKVSERVGPFKVTMNFQVRVTETQERTLLRASLNGADALGLHRMTGSMQIELTPAESGTQMHFAASVEVLGKLATLGAVALRRRTMESFAEFARNIQGQFAKDRA